ncbi:MAG: hypothetical protein FGM55_00295 [Rhodoferax sp.]|nr:hypothetical protein [Rhodoferax sp.]
MMVQESGSLLSVSPVTRTGSVTPPKGRSAGADFQEPASEFSDLLLAQESASDGVDRRGDSTGACLQEDDFQDSDTTDPVMGTDADLSRAPMPADRFTGIPGELLPGAALASDTCDPDVAGVWLQVAGLPAGGGGNGTVTPSDELPGSSLPSGAGTRGRSSALHMTIERPGEPRASGLNASASATGQPAVPKPTIPSAVLEGPSSGRDVHRSTLQGMVGRESLGMRAPEAPAASREPALGMPVYAGEWRNLIEKSVDRSGSGQSTYRSGLVQDPGSQAPAASEKPGFVEMAQAGTDVPGSMATGTDYVDAATYWVAQGVQSAEMTVDGLGDQSVGVRVSMAGERADVSFNSDVPEIRQMLEQTLPQLKEAMASEGLVLAGVSVGTSDRQSDAGAGGQRSRRAPLRVTVPGGADLPLQPNRVVPGRALGPGRSLDLFV